MNKLLPYILFSVLITLSFSCKREKDLNNKTAKYKYNLVPSGKIKSYNLDTSTKYNAFYLYTFKDEKGKEYLSFLNYRTNQILFYDLETCNYLSKLEIDQEGPNGVSMISGFYIQDFNNIYISSYDYAGLIKVDTAKCIIQKIPYGTTDKGYRIVPSYTPSSHPLVSPIIVDKNIYITQQAANHIFPVTETPLSVRIDTVNKTYHQLPITYNILDDKVIQANETSFSRIYNDGLFIYSFYGDENILVTDVDHIKTNRFCIKSKYIDKIPIEKIPEDFKLGAKLNLETARYGDLLYDKYRDVYYRFTYPSTNLDDKIQWFGRAVYGRKKFSVIILDKDFNIIGETLFPEGIYNSYVFFVHKDGLYISRDYQINFDQSEDFMTFELFHLEHN